MLGPFCARHLEVDIELQVLNRDGVVQRMRANQDDLYILSLPPDDLPHERLALLDNPLVPIAALGHPLAGAARVRAARLQQEPFILRERGQARDWPAMRISGAWGCTLACGWSSAATKPSSKRSLRAWGWAWCPGTPWPASLRRKGLPC